jgi:hypothetical protein
MNNCKLLKKNYKEKNENEEDKYNSIAITIYFIFHIILSLFAIYLSWKCNNNTFDTYSFIISLLFPYFYIIIILSSKGTCGLISTEKN